MDLDESIVLSELEAVTDEVDEDLVEPPGVAVELPEDVWPVHIEAQQELYLLKL